MGPLHPLLERQLRRHFGADRKHAPAYDRFLEVVDEAYRAFDADRALLERSLEISSYQFRLGPLRL